MDLAEKHADLIDTFRVWRVSLSEIYHKSILTTRRLETFPECFATDPNLCFCLHKSGNIMFPEAVDNIVSASCGLFTPHYDTFLPQCPTWSLSIPNSPFYFLDPLAQSKRVCILFDMFVHKRLCCTAFVYQESFYSFPTNFTKRKTSV